MIQPVINCVKCQGFMEEGYIIDRGDYNIGAVNTWIEGEPVESFWTGLKVRDKQKFQIKTFRCAGCGYLESYAAGEKAEDSVIS